MVGKTSRITAISCAYGGPVHLLQLAPAP